MELLKRKKLDVFLESHSLEYVEAMLGESGFKGWSVFQGIEGSGAHGAWRQTGIGESSACLVVAIGAEKSCAAALEWLADYFKTYPGIAAVSDVEVMRSERF